MRPDFVTEAFKRRALPPLQAFALVVGSKAAAGGGASMAAHTKTSTPLKPAKTNLTTPTIELLDDDDDDDSTRELPDTAKRDDATDARFAVDDADVRSRA